MPDMEETWLPVPGYVGLYSVSDLGNVMSMNYANTGMLKLMQPRKGNGRNCYYRLTLSNGLKQKHFLVHRLIAMAFLGPVPKGHEVNHISGVKTDNRLFNLEYVTSSQNRLHAYRIGTHVPAHGETHCRAKLTLENVRAIKERLASGISQWEVAKEFNIDRSVISRISCGKRWVRALATGG